MTNLSKILIIILSIISYTTALRLYDSYHYTKLADAKWQNINNQAIIKNLQKLTNEQHEADNINMTTVMAYNTAIQRQNESYAIINKELKDANSKLVKTLNNRDYNRISGLLLLALEHAITNTTMSSIPVTSSGTYGYTTTYQPTDIISSVAGVGKQCTDNREQLINLINWIKDVKENWAK